MAGALKGRFFGIAVLLVWGLIKLPIETGLTARFHREQIGGYKITASLRQQAGQTGFIAVLGGLRAPVADLLFIRAHIAWQQRVEYGRMKLYFDICTTLQPRREIFWDMAAWHMAYNGAAYIEQTEHDPYIRDRQMKEYYKVGEDYLLQAVENCPDSWILYDRLGALYRDKFHDPCKASAAYSRAAERPNRLDYTRRLAVYYLADCPGHEREAYDKLLALYKESEKEWLPTLLEKLQTLERKLGIPKKERVYIPEKHRLPPD